MLIRLDTRLVPQPHRRFYRFGAARGRKSGQFQGSFLALPISPIYPEQRLPGPRRSFSGRCANCLAASKSGEMTSPEETTAPGMPRPLLRLGGCLLVLALALGLGTMIAMWMVMSGGLPTTPLILPPLEEPIVLVDWSLAHQKLAQGEELELTPAHWNHLIAATVNTKIDSGELLSGSGARLIPQPDGTLQLFLTLGFPDDLEAVPWLMRGRFVNLEIVGDIKIVAGTVTHAQLELYQWGSIYKGENLSEEESKEITSDLLSEISPVIGVVHHLEYDGNQLRFSIAR